MERKYVNYAIENRLAVVTIDNPKMNALSDEVMDELDAVFDELEARTEIGVAIITGGGTKAFVAGADIKGFEKLMGNRQGAINDSRRRRRASCRVLYKAFRLVSSRSANTSMGTSSTRSASAILR